MHEQTGQTEQFERYRTHLQAVAYRMLGSVGEAEDAVQEAWLRLSRADTRRRREHGRLADDRRRPSLPRHAASAPRQARGLRRQLAAGADRERRARRTIPSSEALLADSVGLALLVVLENLTPAERLAFVLHDMFGVPFDEIAPIVGRTPAATRQLASRARRRVRGLAPAPDPNIGGQREVVDAFLAASRAGDFEALLSVLDPDVVFRIDSGGIGPEARPPVLGAPAVAERLLARGARFAPHARPAIVNGTAGLIVPAARRAARRRRTPPSSVGRSLRST